MSFDLNLRFIFLSTLLISLLQVHIATADVGIIIKRFNSCDYFIADGENGLYVLEWYGGYDPSEGDRIIGEIDSYGMQDVFYPDIGSDGTVWVEDFLESSDAAIDEIRDHC